MLSAGTTVDMLGEAAMEKLTEAATSTPLFIVMKTILMS